MMDVRELASRLGVPASFIYDRTRTDGPERIPHIKLGKYVRFDPERVEAWLAERERGR